MPEAGAVSDIDKTRQEAGPETSANIPVLSRLSVSYPPWKAISPLAGLGGAALENKPGKLSEF